MVLLLLLILGVFIVIFRRNRVSARIKNKEFENGDESRLDSQIIPSACPLCKNPNANRIRICEWCGHKII
jgi:hypothetical protein